MALPEFDERGDLPEGVHAAAIKEVVRRFGGGGQQRRAATSRLLRIHDVAQATSKLDRLGLFGSYVANEPRPNDVDVVLIMRDGFQVQNGHEETRASFDHLRAADAFGASVFWLRPAMLLLESLDEFIAHRQVKRDHSRRGIVEVRV